MQIRRDFKGIVYEPNNEQEAIALFLFLMHKIRPSWCILQLQTAFPDGIFYDTYNRKKIRVEFEYLASHFIAQKHDEKSCDMMVCWINDLSKAEKERINIEILSLREVTMKMSLDDIYLGQKREGALDDLLRYGIEKEERGYIAVNRVVNIEIPNLEKKFPSLFIDRNTSRHYVLRWDGKGIFGIYPSGRLIVDTPKEYVRKFGEEIYEAGKLFRDTVKNTIRGFNVKARAPEEELNKRIDILINALEEFCRELERIK